MNEWLDYMGEVIDAYGPMPDDADPLYCMMLPDYDW